MKTLKTFVLSVCLLSTGSYAYQIDSLHKGFIITPPVTDNLSQVDYSHYKIFVPSVTLSLTMQNIFDKRLQSLTTVMENSDLLPYVNLTMNDVPILNQGTWGTCVTFASTEALDAALGKGDYISQLCLLQLAAYLHQNDYSPNPWFDNYASFLLSLIREYGIIDKDAQRQGVCNNVIHYPINGTEANDQIEPDKITLSPELYHPYSKKVITTVLSPGMNIAYRVLFEMPDVDSNNTAYNDPYTYISPNQAIRLVKRELANNHRVVIGILLDLNLADSWPILGKYKKTDDTFIMTKAIKEHLQNIAKYTNWGGHEVLIYGYDNNAVAVTPQGRTQKGLFFVRNSWNYPDLNDNNQYMTYQYFKLMVSEATSISVYAQQ